MLARPKWRTVTGEAANTSRGSAPHETARWVRPNGVDLVGDAVSEGQDAWPDHRHEAADRAEPHGVDALWGVEIRARATRHVGEDRLAIGPDIDTGCFRVVANGHSSLTRRGGIHVVDEDVESRRTLHVSGNRGLGGVGHDARFPVPWADAGPVSSKR